MCRALWPLTLWPLALWPLGLSRVPRGLAVDGDLSVPAGPHGGGPVLEAALEERGLDAIEEDAQPARASYAEMKRAEAAQEIDVMLPPQGDVIEIVVFADGGAGHEQQDLVQRIAHPPGLTVVGQLRKMLEQHGEAGPGGHIVERIEGKGRHDGLRESGSPRESRTRVNAKQGQGRR